MKKQIIALLLLAVLMLCILSLTSCKTKTTYQLISEGYDKLYDLDSINAYLDETSVTTTSGVSVEVVSNAGIKVNDIKSGDYKLDASIKLEAMGQKITTFIYYDGSYYYLTAANGDKTKIPETHPEANGVDLYISLKNLTPRLPEELFEAAEVSKEKSQITVSVNLDKNSFNDHFKDYIDTQKKNLAKQLDLQSFEATGCKIDITINQKGYIENYCLTCTYDITAKSQGVSLDVKVDLTEDITFKDLGKDVDIIAPDDLDKYKLQSDISNL